MNTPTSWQTTTSLLIPHPAQPLVLVLPAESAWQLPHFHSPELRWMPEVAYLQPLCAEALGMQPTVLRCSWAVIDREQKAVDAILVLEAPAPDWPPPAGSRWLGQADLASLALANPAHITPLAEYFAEAHGGPIPEQRPPWAQPGWLGRASAWIDQQLCLHALTPTGPSQQIKTWGISAILRTPTTAGDHYFKVASRRPLFAHEPLVTAALAAHFPAHIPQPLAIEPDQAWMLLADFGSALADQEDLAIWRQTVLAYGRIQRAAEPLVAELLTAGCLDRRLDVLASQVEALLTHPQALHLLEPAEQARVQALLPDFLAVIAQLGAYAIPPTLVHGDCHSGNVALRDGQPLFFDWTDACISHPFMDALCLLREPPKSFTAEERLALRDEYLLLWSADEPLERLREAWALCRVVEALHQAVSYYYLTEAMEPRSKFEFERVVPAQLRHALEAYGEVQAAQSSG